MILVLTVVVFINYTLVYGSAEIFVARLALQGQMNYALDNITSAAQSLSAISKHFFGITSNEIESGLPYLMYQVAPSDIIDLRLEYGATFTAPFPSNFSYFFGPHFAPMSIAAASLITGAISAFTVRATSSMNMLVSAISIKTFFLIYVAIMMGNMDLLFGIKGILHFLAIVAYMLIAYNFSGLRK